MQLPGTMGLLKSLRHELNPLDLGTLEEAFEATWAAFKENNLSRHFESDEGLDALVFCVLLDIVCSSGVNDPETLKDLVLAKFGFA